MRSARASSFRCVPSSRYASNSRPWAVARDSGQESRRSALSTERTFYYGTPSSSARRSGTLISQRSWSRATSVRPDGHGKVHEPEPRPGMGPTRAWRCWASAATIAEIASAPRRQVQRILKVFEREGYIDRVERAPAYAVAQCSHYSAPVGPGPPAARRACAVACATCGTLRCTWSSHELCSAAPCPLACRTCARG
jgi:hypothetical protein